MGRSLPGRPEVKVVEKVDSGNDGLLFRADSEQLRRNLACKIIPRANLIHGANGEELWRAEVHKADALRNPAVVRFEDIQEWKDSSAGIDCIVLISEFVDGPSLRKFIRKFKDQLTVPFVVRWLTEMFSLFHEMEQRGVSHGDLHSGNILVEDRYSYSLLPPRFAFRVTDFGVGESLSNNRFKDDYLQLAMILKELLEAIDYSLCSQKDKFIFDKLRHELLARHLVEMDQTRDPLARRPQELFRRLGEFDAQFEEFKQASENQSDGLISPFDFLSCEQIGESSSLLHALYSDRFLGLPEIEGRNNIVVTGPRGCGKSMVFRSLSLDQRLRVGEADPDDIRYIGVYYRCDDLYFAFPRYKAPDMGVGIDIPIHFITATLLSKLLDSFERWARQYFGDEFGRAQPLAARSIWEVLGIGPPAVPGSETLRVIIAQLNKERNRAAEWHRFVNDPKRTVGHCFGPEILQRACEALGAAFHFLRDRPVYFLVDDYSSPKVTEKLQENLNRIFMQRAAFCFFKLSTESSVSFTTSDIDGKSYVESREFILHNLGIVYLHAEVEQKLSFVDDVFRRRLAKTVSQFPARELEELVGHNLEQNQNNLARQIRGKEKPSLWGMETLCQLCSGDIHYLISLVESMVRSAGGVEDLAKRSHVPKLRKEEQNRAIREAAGGFLKNLRGVPGCGGQLVAIVEAFGNVAHSHLKFMDSKNESGSPPKQASRIEPYEYFRLSAEAQQIYRELLRYSVFLEDFRGKSRRGHVVQRLYLRRFLIPHFQLTFSMRDSIELEPSEFEEFLLHPQEFERLYRLKSLEDVERLRRREEEAAARVDQLKLFPEQGEEMV
jgi:serine/threonine protein kinase